MQIEHTQLEALLDAHIQKPQKVFVYKPNVEANLVNSQVVFKPTWSWWAFFGGWAFFLYRKMYLMAAVFFLLGFVATLIPLGNLILAIVSGVSGFYFYTKKFYEDLQIAQYGQRPIEEVKQTLKYLGGYHTWVVVLAVIYYLFWAIFALPIILATLAIQ